MNDASRWRRDLAEQFAPTYYAIPDVHAVVLAGSVARGCADRFSDVEMTVIWDTAPSDAARLDAVTRGGGVMVSLYPFDADEAEWSDDIHVQGVEFQVSHRTVAQVEQWLTDVLERYDTALNKQDLIAIFQFGIPLYGADVIAGWRARVATYPVELAQAMLAEHLWFKSAWNRTKQVERGELMQLYDDLTQSSKRLILSLLALNRVYLPHLGFKWLDRLGETLPIAPPDLDGRLGRLFTTSPREAASTLDDLIRDTFTLVEQHMPAVDTHQAHQDFEQVRPIWDAPPSRP